ncbi:hypothetical protein B0H19DRAFT_442658 [Mycena capillaripes]|nr:hypothetical protein B0H19DRAFT_442658 [Mycena capillaripes]
MVYLHITYSSCVRTMLCLRPSLFCSSVLVFATLWTLAAATRCLPLFPSPQPSSLGWNDDSFARKSAAMTPDGGARRTAHDSRSKHARTDDALPGLASLRCMGGVVALRREDEPSKRRTLGIGIARPFSC